MRLEIEMRCKSCGAAYVPTKQDLLRGPAVYRYCKQCREPPSTGAAPIEQPAAA